MYESLEWTVIRHEVFCELVNPLTAGVAYILVFIFSSAHEIPHFKYGKDKM